MSPGRGFGWLLLLLILAGLARAADPPAQAISLQLQWKHQFEFAGFYAAQQQGYYRELGLDVEIHEYSRDTDLLDEVVSGRSQFGVWGAQLISERLRGAPIQLVANYFKRSPLVILTAQDIRLPSDLRGRRIMIPPGDIDTVSYRTMFKQFDLSRDDMTIVPHSFRVDEFVAGEVDAMSAFLTDQPFRLHAAGKAFNVLDPSHYGAELYDVTLFTSARFAEQHPDSVRAFRNASNRGWAYALDHPDEIIELILARYNTQALTPEALQFEARETAKIVLPRVYPVGSIDADKLRRMGELYVQLGEVASLAALDGFVFDAPTDASPQRPAVRFAMSAEERAFVQAHPLIRISNERDWPPFDFFENGAPQGYSVGLMRLLAEQIGVKLEFVQADTWAELIELFCARKIDLLHPTGGSGRVGECGLLTPPIIRETTQFLTRKDHAPIRGINDLFGSVIATPTGWRQTELLRRRYGDRLQLVETPGIQQAIDAVRDGSADATTDFGSSLHYYVNRLGYTNLRVHGVWDQAGEGGEIGSLRVATRNDWSLFHGLVVRALDAISAAEKRQLQAQWLDPASEERSLELSDAERAFLRQHPVLRASNETDYPPYDFAVGGQPRGYSIDLLELLARRAGFRVEYVTGPPWDALVEQFRQGRIDLLHSLYRTPEREAMGLFSDPYMRTRSVFVTRKDEPEINSFEQLQGKTVAVGAGWAQESFIAARYPGIKRVAVANMEQMLDAVSRGHADATVEGEPALRYFMAQQGLTDLKVSGWARELDAESMGSHHFMAQNSAPQWVSILNKAMASLTPAELEELQAKWLYPSADAISRTSQRIALDAEETAYLTRKGELRLCTDPESPPYERINEDGEHEGIAADVAALVSERLGVRFELHRTRQWSESLAALRTRQCDLLLMATDLPSRRDAMAFTRPYLVEPLVVATRGSELFVKDAEAIGTRRVGIIRGYSFAELLHERYPQMHIVDVDSIEDGLQRVRQGELWGYIGSMPSVAFALAKQRMLDLKIAGRLDMEDALSVATRSDEPQLLAIMQKAVDSISDDERRAMVNRWVAVRFEQGFDYALFWKIALAMTLLLLGLYFWNRKLARLNHAIQRAQGQTQAALDQVATLLDNSGQGFLSFARDLTVAPGYSRECARIFECEVLGHYLPELLCNGDPDRRSFLAKTLPLAMDADTPLRHDAYLNLLPREYQHGGRSYRADYRLLQDRRMMLVLTDISAEKRLRERLAQERMRLEFIVGALENRDDVLAMLGDFDRFRSRTLPDLLSAQREPRAVLSELYRHIHTFKGLFAQANLPTMPEQLHALEGRLSQLKERGSAVDLADIKRELGNVDLGAVLERDLAVLREKLGNDYFNAEREIHIAASALDTLEVEAAALYGEDSRVLTLIRQLRYEPLQALIAPHCRAAEILAKRQHKPLHAIVCEGEPVAVDPAIYGPFCKTLVHLFRNAVDHGIEDADSRLLSDKPELARIHCLVATSPGCLQLTVADDGRGLDAGAIRQRAAAGGLLDIDEAEALSDAQALQLVFVDGFSTRDEVSDVSGRGVGLTAVQHELQRLGGRVQIDSTPGQGTRFRFELPYSPAPLPRGGRGPLQAASRLLSPLPQVFRAFCENHLRLPISLDETLRELCSDELAEFTVRVPLGGKLNASLGLSMQRPLLLEMTRRFESGFTADEIVSLADSVGAEVANTLVGNATVYYSHFDWKVAMGTPQIVAPEQRADAFGRRTFRGYVGSSNGSRFILFCTLNEEPAS